MINFQLTLKCSFFVSFSIFLCMDGVVQAKNSTAAVTSLGFVVEYAVWRGWHQVILQIPDIDAGYGWIALRLVKCLGVNGIAAAVNIKRKAETSSSLGIVVIAPVLGQATIKRYTSAINQMNQWEMNTASYDWLIMIKSVDDFKILSDVLNATALRFDQNIVLALTDVQWPKNRSFSLCDYNFKYKRNDGIWKNNNKFNKSSAKSLHSYTDHRTYSSFYNSNKTEAESNYYRASERFRDIARNRKYKVFDKELTLFQSGVLNYNFSRTFKMMNVSHFSIKSVIRKWNYENNIEDAFFNVYLVQCFRVRVNSTLYVEHIGAWSPMRSMSLVKTPYPVEARNFMGEKFIFGRCNSTTEESPASDDDGPSAPGLLDDILQFLTLRLNAESVTRYYGKLGFRTYEGVWTGLLGAVMDHSVDIALEPVTAIVPRHKDMNFIFPITDTMCNIYIRHQETSAVRDIFLAPFSPKLILCVSCMAFVIAVTVVIISRSATSSRQDRRMSCIEGIIWSIGILCQQGGTWTPQNPAASILLIVCLFFALITYNAYAAFITSVLSIRVASVSSLSDVLLSNLKIGYVRNGADQMYLMSTKDVQLNAFYIRGYSEAENLVSTAEEGLVRAARQDYAFFAGQRVARSTLRSLSQARGRCDLRELPVQSTRAQLAFPLPSRSPYARPILVRYTNNGVSKRVALSLLQLRSGAVLSRLEAALVPAMPQCAPTSGFASARAADVKTALFVIFSGLLAGFLLGAGEYFWKNRRHYNSCLKRNIQRLFN